MAPHFQRFLFCIVAFVVLTDVVWASLVHFDIDIGAYLALAALSVALAGGGIFYDRVRKDARLSAMLLATGFLVSFSAGFSVLNYFLLTVAGPRTLVPAGVEGLGCTLAATVEEAMEGADAVMALRLQRERMDGGLLPSLGEFSRVWGLTPERVRLLDRDAVVLHPGPMNRGVEVTAEVADSERSVILDQVENGVALRCAVLARCAAARTPPGRSGRPRGEAA